jgi:hypothetical protein
MSKALASITDIPKEIGLQIGTLVAPLSRIFLFRALSERGLNFDFTTASKRHSRVWNMFFKDESWFKAIETIKYIHFPSPIPTLLGRLWSIYYGSSKSGYIVLQLSDWGGDCQDFKKLLFMSLKEHTYDAQKFEVHFKNHNIILNIYDAVAGRESIVVENPKTLFRFYRKSLQTAALFLNDENLVIIGPEKIGGIIDQETKSRKRKLKFIEELCSIELRFSNGRPIRRLITKRDSDIRVVGIEENADGFFNWRRAKLGERGYTVGQI